VLSWTASTGANSYNVYRGTSSGGETLLANNVTSVSYTDANLNNNTQYFYQVSAVNTSGEGVRSIEVSATPQASLPSAPAGVVATAGNAQIVLSWTASSGATSYNVYRGAASGGETQLTTGIVTASYTDKSVSNGTAYYYYVTAVDGTEEGIKSSEVSATPTAGFSISNSSAALSITGSTGQATSVLTIVPNGDARTLSFACSGLPAAYSCGFAPATLALSGLSAKQTVTMTVSSQTASLSTDRPMARGKSSILLGALLPSSLLFGLLLPFGSRRGRRLLMAVAALAIAASLSACGSSANSSGSSTISTPSTYNFQVNVTTGNSVAQSLNYTLTVQ
jgi:hypothetical protein